jgi:hypothetical protein
MANTGNPRRSPSRLLLAISSGFKTWQVRPFHLFPNPATSIIEYVMGQKEAILHREMRYFHEVVVNHYGEVISGHTVCFQQNFVVNQGRMETHFATDQVCEPEVFIFGHPAPYDVWRISIQQFLHVCGIKAQRIYLHPQFMIILR